MCILHAEKLFMLIIVCELVCIQSDVNVKPILSALNTCYSHTNTHVYANLVSRSPFKCGHYRLNRPHPPYAKKPRP